MKPRRSRRSARSGIRYAPAWPRCWIDSRRSTCNRAGNGPDRTRRVRDRPAVLHAMDKPTEASVTHVEILGRQYPIRSRLDSDDVARLGTYVREKMEAVANRAPRRDLVHVAVLAALNIADDYFRSLDGRANDERHVLDRMLAIEAMVDRAVSGGRAPD
ncbi:MAG: cell division protein ZapA [Acidobacteria bacterium]|nr:cell division protein ZapA [Acidobacteriota bacterium]